MQEGACCGPVQQLLFIQGTQGVCLAEESLSQWDHALPFGPQQPLSYALRP